MAVRTRLWERGMSITALAHALGFHRNTVSQAINHPILPTVRRKISAFLKLP
jgi:plasmid maintenance system antidote protein VapI